jgi:predicted amidophosphoribosyltransferase
VYKDQGEQRLAGVMADVMARVLPLGWDIDAVTFVPATLPAVRRRGVDHAELLARELACRIGLPCEPQLDRPKTRDQRALGATQRIANLADSFKPIQPFPVGSRLLLVDDVFTTGATLCAASQALREAGTTTIHAATFARV